MLLEDTIPDQRDDYAGVLDAVQQEELGAVLWPMVDSLGERGVSLSARGWTRTEDYWQARWDTMEKIKLVFDQEGIRISHFERNVPILLDSEQTRRQS